MIILLILLVLIVFGAVMYNKLVQGRIHVQEGLSGVDVQLKRRHDLIPNLVEAVKGYMAHERALLEKVTELRSKGMAAEDIKERAAVENDISRTLKSIFAVVEAYPNLKADRHFLQLQQDLTTVEDELQLARRYYNGTVRNYNILVESFPGNLVAGLFSFQRAQFFEVDEAADRAAPQVKI